MPPTLDALRSRHVVTGVPSSDDLIPYIDVDEVGNSVVKKSLVSSIGASTASVQAALAADPAGAREAAAAAEQRGIDRLVNYRSAVYNNGAYRRPNILFFGDSMIATATVALRQMIESSGEISGWGLLPGTASRLPAMLAVDACVKWINGETWVLSQSGDYVEFAYNGVGAIEGDLLKIYHLQQSGGGNFKIQSSVDGAAFADETGYTSIATAGTTAGVVTTVTKTTYAKTYKIRAVWISGTVNIIGGGIRDSKRFGPVVSFITNGSTAINNIDNAKNTARAITDPIFADLAPNLIVLSHLDGAASVTANQGELQDNIAAGVVSGGAPAPSWVIVGPPIGYNTEQDDLRIAQQAAQQTLADLRIDAFFDNRTWALPVSTVVSRGLITDTTHYAQAAQLHWVPSMFRDLGIFDHTLYNKNSVPSLDIMFGGVFRGSVSGTPTSSQTETMHLGNIRIQAPPGTTGVGFFYMMDSAGPANNNDWARIGYTSNVYQVDLSGGGHGFSATNNTGQFEFYPFDTALNSRLGTTAARWGVLTVGGVRTATKTITAGTAAAATEKDNTIFCNAVGGAITQPIPAAAAANAGLELTIKKIDASVNAVTIGGTVDGVVSPTITTQWGYLCIKSDGAAWYRVG